MTDERRPGEGPMDVPDGQQPDFTGGYPPPPPPPSQPGYGPPGGYGAPGGSPPPPAGSHGQPGYGQPYGQAPYGDQSYGPTYGQPYGGYVANPTTNGLAIASMILGIVGIVFIPIIGSILALVLGYMARGQIRDSQGRQGGGGFATAGIIMGWVGIALGILMIVFFIMVFSVAVSQPEFREGFENFPTFAP